MLYTERRPENSRYIQSTNAFSEESKRMVSLINCSSIAIVGSLPIDSIIVSFVGSIKILSIFITWRVNDENATLKECVALGATQVFMLAFF